MTDNRIIELTADIVSAHVSNNKVATDEVSDLIRSIFDALTTSSTPAAAPEESLKPAVPIRSSIKHDYIVCLEDGAKLKMLKRYLRTNYNLSPVEYRAKWSLPKDYPMVAPAYAEQRRSLAKEIGLGRKKSSISATAGKNATLVAAATAEPNPKPIAKPARRVGKKAATAGGPGEQAVPASTPAKRGRKPKAPPAAPATETAG